jgi:type I restriction enzyme R subunit
MSIIQWEYEVAEKPFCQQLASMGWESIEGDPDLPESTERTSSREVLLRGRLAKKLREIYFTRPGLLHR